MGIHAGTYRFHSVLYVATWHLFFAYTMCNWLAYIAILRLDIDSYSWKSRRVLPAIRFTNYEALYIDKQP